MPRTHYHLAPLIVALSLLTPIAHAAAQPLYPIQPGPTGVTVFAPPVIVEAPGPGPINSAGWNTGYSAVTSTYERPNPFGHALGGSETVHETVTQVVPNNALGQPMPGPRYFGARNSAGWNTGYSVVTDTYQRVDPLGAALGGSSTVTESATRVVPNDALGRPLTGLGIGWP